MNTQLTDDRRVSTLASLDTRAGLRRTHPPSPPPTPLERLALRIGITLIIWGRRGKLQADRSELTRRYEARAAREKREREYQQSWMLAVPRR